MMLKRLFPRSLFGRALLIVVLPTILAQAVTAYIFYDRHWDNVTRHMGNALAGEIAYIAYAMAEGDEEQRARTAYLFTATTGITMRWEKDARLTEAEKRTVRAPHDFVEFRRQLAERLQLPFVVERVGREDDIRVRVQYADDVLVMTASVKRLESPTTGILLMWMSGAALLFLIIALLFLRNQVRPIRELAEAAENFGKGVDIVYFKPAGAAEVRRAGRAFLVMRERILRQLRTRTEMLAGISHDLRTPLTRMKLQLAMLPKESAASEMSSDVSQMERMIQEYLDFARGDGGEAPEEVAVASLLEEVAEDYRRMGKKIKLGEIDENAVLMLRPLAMRRLLHNLIDNALHYGGACEMHFSRSSMRAEIVVDDNGPGIPPGMREEVFRPFTRLDESRNPNTGGVGLGLSIARDIALAHGGEIVLEDSPLGGLRVSVRLPV